MVVCGDLNFRWPTSSNLQVRQRHRDFARFVDETGLQVVNSSASNCCHQERVTVNDYTLSKGVSVSGWIVLNDESLSDHLYSYICFTANEAETRKGNFYTILEDTEKLKQRLSDTVIEPLEISDRISCIEAANRITNFLTQVVADCSTKKKTRPKVPWWSGRFEDMATSGNQEIPSQNL